MSELIVDFMGLDNDANLEKNGSLIYDGEEFTKVSIVSTQASIQDIIDTPLLIHGEKDPVEIKAEDDPVNFMKMLHYQYRSPYFYATFSRKLTEQDLEGLEILNDDGDNDEPNTTRVP